MNPMLRRPEHRTALTALLIALGAWACLFDEDPQCFEDGDCRSLGICIDRRCVGDTGPMGDGTMGDGTPADRGDPADSTSSDAAPPDAAPMDAMPDTAPPCVPRGEEACNGLDDDCDGATDEEVVRCNPPEHCHWRHRGHQSYLFCDSAVSQSAALTLCRDQLSLAMAVPESCNEMHWMFATGNLVPSTVLWNPDDRGRAWWLGFILGEPDSRVGLRRVDGRVTALEECWMTGEPDGPFDMDPVLGETCVDLLYNRELASFGWNDELCTRDNRNPINALCETRCDPDVDADEDGEDACVDCDDTDPMVRSGDAGGANCAPIPRAGLPPEVWDDFPQAR